MARTAAVILAVLGLAAAAPAAELVDANDPETLAGMLRSLGPATLVRDQFGDPLIVAEAAGTPYRVEFYGCSEGRDCTGVMLAARWQVDDPDADRLAEWNRERRFGKAYLDDEDAPAIEMDVNLAGGVSRANMEDTLGRWLEVMKEFIDFNDF